MVFNIRWVNGVLGCGKIIWVVKNFDGERDVVVIMIIEVVKDLREKFVCCLGDKINIKVCIMVLILVNGFKN